MRAAIRTERVSVTGIVDNRRLTDELRRARVALVSQHYEGAEFNVPSKLMNFMGDGLATVASVGPQSEVARILRDSGGGWVTSSLRPEEAMETLASVLPDDILLAERGKSALEFARTNFAAEHTAALFEEVLLHAVAGRPRRTLTSGEVATARFDSLAASRTSPALSCRGLPSELAAPAEGQTGLNRPGLRCAMCQWLPGPLGRRYRRGADKWRSAWIRRMMRGLVSGVEVRVTP